MTSKRQGIPWVIGLTVCSLIGLIILQGLLLRNAYELKEQAFARNVSSALLSASFRLQAGEALTEMIKVQSSRMYAGARILRSGPAGRSIDTVMWRTETTGLPQSDPQQRVTITGDAFAYRFNNILPESVAFARTRKHDSVAMIVQITERGNTGIAQSNCFPDSARMIFVSRVVDNLSMIERQPLSQRFHQDTLESVLRQSMAEAGISLGFTWGILTASHDSARPGTVEMAHPSAAAAVLAFSEFHTPLSPLNPTGSRELLVVDFPGRSVYVLRQMWLTLAASLFFIGLIVLAFVYTIRTIIRQQRLAVHMVDFVNTMTHEFKTPLSTVTLASEAINRPDVVGRKAQVLRYSKMIADETARMKIQVDRILEVAQLEDGDLELALDKIHLHELIRTTAGTFALQVEARGGSLTLDLSATNDVVNGDSVHLGNVLRSILDNANKYSPSMPVIAVHSEQRETMFIIAVSDRGIGIPPEHQRRVFEKFYRVPKGNLHDVKGFGIGLSYIKLIVEAHRGTVSLESSPGEGTTVTVALPLYRHAEG